jgi:alkylhydroperoxidase family enzyme
VSGRQIKDLKTWRLSHYFSAKERAALQFAEAVTRGRTSNAAYQRMAEYFSEAEQLELVVTVAAYAMVSRILDALAIPPEP